MTCVCGGRSSEDADLVQQRLCRKEVARIKASGIPFINGFHPLVWDRLTRPGALTPGQKSRADMNRLKAAMRTRGSYGNGR